MNFKLVSVIAVFAVFSVYSALIIFDHGYTGFIELALTGGWAMQVFIDLCIALTLFLVWMFGDSKNRGLPFWPYLIATLTLGSIGALAYLVHRTIREGNEPGAHHPATN